MKDVWGRNFNIANFLHLKGLFFLEKKSFLHSDMEYCTTMSAPASEAFASQPAKLWYR